MVCFEPNDAEVEWSLRARMESVSQLACLLGLPLIPLYIGAEDLLPVPDGQRRVTRFRREENLLFFCWCHVKVGRKATSVDGGSLA